MRPGEHGDPPELIPYASHVAHGTGRTPIGIILFSASHLLLGGVIALAIVRFLLRVPLADRNALTWVAAIGGFSVAMMVGSGMLLMKGRVAWMVSIAAFAIVAMYEIALAALGVTWWYQTLPAAPFTSTPGLYFAALTAVMASILFSLSVVLLHYLGGAKARATFGLTPGEAPIAVQLLPAALTLIFCASVIATALLRP